MLIIIIKDYQNNYAKPPENTIQFTVQNWRLITQ